MADERYKKFLDIEPAGETPSYYELLDIDPHESDEEVLEKAYKTQIRKLQQIRTSKDAGWIEYNKETLRTARRTLKNRKKRAEYDLTLTAGAEEEFSEFVVTLLAMLSQTMIDTVLVPKGVNDGLTEERARQIIEEIAAEHNVTIQAESENLTDSSDDYDDGYDDGYDDTGFDDSSYDDGAKRGEVVLKASPGWTPEAREAAVESAPRPAEPVAQVQRAMPPWVMGEDETDDTPWGRGGSRSWGRHSRSRKRSQQAADLVEDSWLDEESRKRLGDAIRAFNHGARLAKVGSDVHRNLRMYFPPANGKTVATQKISGVSYEKLFETERRTYQDTLKAFRDAQGRVGDTQSPRADDLRQRGGKNVALVKSYLEEMNRHKMNMMGQLSKAETLRTWQTFVVSRRSPRLHRTIEEIS